MAHVPKRAPVPCENLARRVTALMLLLGSNRAAQKLGSSRLVLTSIAAGLPVRRGSILLVEMHLSAVEQELALERTSDFVDASKRSVALRRRLSATKTTVTKTTAK